MIETFEYKGDTYPELQKTGFAARFIFPFAKEICNGVGIDVGYSKPEWKFPGALGIDYHRICTTDAKNEMIYDVDALNIPGEETIDYVFSSHCLEHLPNWVEALDHWSSKLKPGGVLFLYLPHPDQKYWRPHNNSKHIHVLHPDDIVEYLIDRGYSKVFASGQDLNCSYCVMAEKPIG